VRPSLSTVLRTATHLAVWLVLAAALTVVVFLHSSRTSTLASHDAVLRPDLGGKVVLRTGPVLPDVRIDSGSRVGVEVTLGKTTADSTEDLVERYALIAGDPEGPETRIREDLGELLAGSVLRGAALGAVPLLVWVLVGSNRRRELASRLWRPRWIVVALTVGGVTLALTQPWQEDPVTVESGEEWIPLQTFLGPDVALPEDLEDVEVRGDVTTSQTRRLIASAVDTYETSRTFYRQAVEDAADLVLREPAADETVAVLVSDRHDNIGMDAVARAVADRAGASAVLDAGDDTSTGRPWEAFSLDSLVAAFDDDTFQDRRWVVAGNHDNGTFVSGHLADHGWTVLEAEVVEGPGGGRILGVSDPRSSGLGNWRDETELTFAEVAERLADAACAADESGERIDTILVHDANLADPTLERGCADLVLAGHTHVRSGPTAVTGESGEVGYTFTNGTTGGAAYAIAVGSKPRRDADLALVTYRDGSPVGIQSVLLRTNGVFVVGEYLTLAGIAD
jgi:predicted phosphodiesterase